MEQHPPTAAEPPPPADPASPRSIAQALGGVSGIELVARAVASSALSAADARDAGFGRGGGALELDRAQAETPLGNVVEIVERGVEASEQGLLLATLVALGVDAEPRVAERLVWLTSHTPVPALLALDAALGDRAGALWNDVASVAIAPESAAHDFGRLEALTAVAAMRSSSAGSAALADVAERSVDPVVRALAASDAAGAAALAGEIGPAPRGPVATLLLAVTGILLVLHVGRLIGRFALAYRRPARVRLGDRGLEIEHRTELLGRVLRDRESLVPLQNLARVTREVRYPRVGMYAGLMSLVIGSYLGLGLLVDGVRVPGGSPPLLGLGLLLIALGIGIDFALTTLSDGVRGRCRLVVVPKKGRRVCVGQLDPRQADRMLNALAERSRTQVAAG